MRKPNRWETGPHRSTFIPPTRFIPGTWGANRKFVAHGREEIRALALGWYMSGFEKWTYPYQQVIIDDQQGIVVAFYDQVPPRNDRTAVLTKLMAFRARGLNMLAAGNYCQWKRQLDFFDMGNVVALTFELASAGELDVAVKEKMRNQFKGQTMPGVVQIRNDDGSWWW